MAKKNTFKNIFKTRNFMISLNLAVKGIIYLFLYHRNMRLIFISGILVFLSGIYLKLKGIELVALCITITLVFMAEIFNTAIELMMDALTEEYHVKIKLIKDIAAGVVLLACLNALGVGYVLLFKKI
ncbi:MAG: diacylglycerol kinase family protein [Candidatus Omnitrophica bacterium]|nr:diacylglycerol kinase family protein [Candidatus Omnitrophota bacterium]